MTNKPTVLVDMDGVLTDFDGAVLARLPQAVARVPRANFYIVRDYPAHKADVAAIYSHPDFFYELEPVPDAMLGWQRLLELGYAPRICSAPLTLNAKSVEGKIAWLERHLVPHFGREVVDAAIFDKNKHAHDGLALIDDKPDIDTNGGAATWRHVVFDRPYNAHVGDDLRLRGWRDADLGAILARAGGRSA
ncbi:hypothetical protein L2K20_05455 [Mycobacterium sp. MBM]|nr:hypothetical protein [Mycobacterium sp. MBM]